MKRKNLGDILLKAGRVTPADVENALEYQRLHGGYFGQALVALGLVRTEEVEWALASQFDLPLIFPDADTVDPEVAALVPADWSLTNLAVPIVRAGDTLTVVVENPLDTDTVNDLHQRTGLQIELALAPSARIRDLVRELYGDAGGGRAVEGRAPVSLLEFLDLALNAGADPFGISARGQFAVAWYGTGEKRARRHLTADWRDTLMDVVHPSPAEHGVDGAMGLSRWSATIRTDFGAVQVDAQALVGAGGADYLFRPRHSEPSTGEKDPVVTIPPAIAAEMRVLGRDGARVAFVSDDATFANSVLPELPALIWGDGVRGAHVTAGPVRTPAETHPPVEDPPPGGTLMRKVGPLLGLGSKPEPESSPNGSPERIPSPPKGRSHPTQGAARSARAATGAQTPFTLLAESPADPLLEALSDYRFDILSVDLPTEYSLEPVFASAPIILARMDGAALARMDGAAPVRMDAAGREERLEELGFGWILEVRTREQGEREWKLRAVRD